MIAPRKTGAHTTGACDRLPGVTDNIYLELTRRFNRGRLRAILSSGQAVVLHGLAVMSKDGDWILREDEECTGHILQVLEGYGARYRYGAPLDSRWLSGGWSSHLEFSFEGLRVRTDFVTRPPRLDPEAMERLWADHRPIPFVDAASLAELKKTNRERDYAVIGELARLMSGPREQLLHSRSARDLIRLARAHPELAAELARTRPLLAAGSESRETLEVALDAERRRLIRVNEARLARYAAAAEPWAVKWPALVRKLDGLPLPRAHAVMVEEALGALPFAPAGAP